MQYFYSSWYLIGYCDNKSNKCYPHTKLLLLLLFAYFLPKHKYVDLFDCYKIMAVLLYNLSTAEVPPGIQMPLIGNSCLEDYGLYSLTVYLVPGPV